MIPMRLLMKGIANLAAPEVVLSPILQEKRCEEAQRADANAP
jgi:hypothetical protein